MTGRPKFAHAWWRRIGVLVGVGAFLVGLGAGVTSASWVDEVHHAGTATSSAFDIQGRFAATAEWEDVGLPGNPDTYPPGFEIEIPPIFDVLPGHSYFGDVFLCNAGNVDGVITAATLAEITTTNQGESGPPLVLDGSIQVENIDVGSVIPAGSCEPSSVADPANDVEGVIHFTTVEDFTGRYGATSSIVIRIEVESR